MLYYTDGYADRGYVEGDDLAPIEPIDKIVSIARQFVLDGVDITDHVIRCELIREVDKPFHTASLDIADIVIDSGFIRNPSKRLVITIGSDVYSTIIFDMDKDYRDNVSIISKTEGCLLDFPFSPKSNDTFIGDSNTIIRTFMDKLNLGFVNLLPNFEFLKGSFILNGSYLDGLRQLIDVAGGTLFESSGKIVLEKHFRITNGIQPRLILNNEILTSKELSDNYDGSPLVKKIIFNPIFSDIISEPLITMITDDDDACKRPKFLFNPAPSKVSAINSNLGDIEFTTITQTYTDTLMDSRIIRVSGAIQSISTFLLDGTPFTNYTFEVGHNVILFDRVRTGAVSITYTTKAVLFYTKNGTYDTLNKQYNYKVQYLTQLLDASVQKCTADESSGGTNNDLRPTETGCRVMVTPEISRDTNIVIEIAEGYLKKMLFIQDSQSSPRDIYGLDSRFKALGGFDDGFLRGLREEQGVIKTLTIQSTMQDVTAEVSPNSSTKYYGIIVPKNIVASEIMIGNSVVSCMDYNPTNKSYRIYYTHQSVDGANVVLSYTSRIDRYTIPACGGDNNIKLIDVYTCNTIHTINYPTGGDDKDDPLNVGICTVPADITLNISALLNLKPEDISGKSISDGTASYTIASNGMSVVTISSPTSYKFDTAHLRKGSYITVDANNAEVE
jgi:hypothetical protein